MKSILLLLTSCLFISLTSLAGTGPEQILGEWISEPRDGKILIYKQGDRYFGKISWGKTPGRKDINNPDPKLKNRDLIGLVILQNFKYTGSHWDSGTVYDPHSGKTYDCIIKVKDNNQKLDIRGFIGSAMFGRTSTWTRS
jgi:uncharacterized protein (DUF2147 family)